MIHRCAGLSRVGFNISSKFCPLKDYAVGCGPGVGRRVTTRPNFTRLRPLRPTSAIRNTLAICGKLTHFLSTVAKVTRFALGPFTNTPKRLAKLVIVHRCRVSHNSSKHAEVVMPSDTRNAGPTSTTIYNLRVIRMGSGTVKLVSISSLGPLLSRAITNVVVAGPGALNLFRGRVGRVTTLIRRYNNLLRCSNRGVGRLINIIHPKSVNFSIVRLGLRGAFSAPRNKNNPNTKPINITTRLTGRLPYPKVNASRDRSYKHVSKFVNGFNILLETCTCVLVLKGRRIGVINPLSILNTGCVGRSLGSYFGLPVPAIYGRRFIFSNLLSRSAKMAALSITGELLSCKFRTPAVCFPLLFRRTVVVRPARARSGRALSTFVRVVGRVTTRTVRSPRSLGATPRAAPIHHLSRAATTHRPVLACESLWVETGEMIYCRFSCRQY